MDEDDILRAKVVFCPEQQQQQTPQQQQQVELSMSISTQFEGEAEEAPISEGLTTLLSEYGGLFEPLSMVAE